MESIASIAPCATSGAAAFAHPASPRAGDMRGVLTVPVVFGPNRLRGACTGAMVRAGPGDDEALSRLRGLLAAEAQAAGVHPDAAFVAKCVSQLLRLYERQAQDYRARRTDELGFVLELATRGGQRIALAEPGVLRRLGVCIEA